MPIGSIISGLFGAHSNSQAIDAQKEENQKTREYNLSLARLQNQWNVDQWQRENEYNTPAAQMARFKAAGLNPDLIYGQSNTGGQISGSLTSGAPANPADIGSLLQSKGQHLANAANITAQRMANAQIKNIEADTQNKRTEGDILKTDSSFRNALNQGQIDLQNAQLLGINSNIAKNTQEIAKMRQECVNLQSVNDNLIAEYDKIRATVANLDSDTAYKRIRSVLDSKETEANIRKLAASANLDMATARSVVSKLTYELAGLRAQAANIEVSTENLKKLGISYDIENDTMRFEYNQAVDYNDWERKTGIYKDICLGLTPIAAVIGTALGAGTPKTIKGFRR